MNKLAQTSESAYLTKQLYNLRQKLSQKKAAVELTRLRTKRQKQCTVVSDVEKVTNEHSLILKQTSCKYLQSYVERLRELKMKLSQYEHNDGNQIDSHLFDIINERNEALVIFSIFIKYRSTILIKTVYRLIINYRDV